MSAGAQLRGSVAYDLATDAVITALEAIRAADTAAVHHCLAEGRKAIGTSGLTERLCVAARALALDARLGRADDRALVGLLPEIAVAARPFPELTIDEIPRILAGWRDTNELVPENPTHDLDLVLAVLVAFLIDRLGYPPEVMA